MNETCSLVEEKIVEIADSVKHETYETTATGDPNKVEEKKTTTRAVHEVTEYHWMYNLSYALLLADDDTEMMTNRIQSRLGTEIIVITGSEKAPCQSHYMHPHADIDLSWFLQQLHSAKEGDSGELRSQFSIDRDASSCKTPRRNDDVETAVEAFGKLKEWAWRVSSYFQNTVALRLSPQHPHHPRKDDEQGGYDDVVDLLRSIDDSTIFVPVLPLFRQDTNTNSSASSDLVLSSADVDVLLAEQYRTIDNTVAAVGARFKPKDDKSIASTAEARLILLMKHVASISSSFDQGVNHVESMLRSQLVSAVGREISSSDFDHFVKTFYPKLLKPEYVPESFVYAVRRPNHYPDGTLSIEITSGDDNDEFEPVLTSTRKIEGGALMRMPINAATSIHLSGEQFLHAWIRHEFGRFTSFRAQAQAQAQLVARARQFSSFVLLIGNIAGSNSFHPKHAIIVQNKDEVIIPLLLEQLPTPKEFRDATRSLSPEQREFAQEFRSMQLESSVFALAVVQLKPQLENVLGLPDDSLTKEIKLTKDLLELFIDHQIPPDLLSYDKDEAASFGDKLSRVKENVKAVQTMIQEAKIRELKEAEIQTDMKAGGRKHREKTKFSAASVPTSMDYMLADDVVEMDEATLMASSIPQMKSAQAVPERMAAKRMLQEESRASPSASSITSEHHLRATSKGETNGSSDVSSEDNGRDREGSLGNTIDFSRIAKRLDAAFDAFDVDSALRPTKVSIQDTKDWKKTYQKTLLTPQEQKYLSTEEKRQEKNKAFDLLDALSRSGAQPIGHSELHVIVAATHRFDHSLIDTVIRSNENPISSVERSALIVSSTIHDDATIADLVLGPSRLSLIKEHSPGLLEMGKHGQHGQPFKEEVSADEAEMTLLN